MHVSRLQIIQFVSAAALTRTTTDLYGAPAANLPVVVGNYYRKGEATTGTFSTTSHVELWQPSGISGVSEGKEHERASLSGSLPDMLAYGGADECSKPEQGVLEAPNRDNTRTEHRRGIAQTGMTHPVSTEANP